MTKFHIIIMILGSGLFFWDITFGVGWILGWLFAGLLRQFREPILERIIDFNNFSVLRYIVYLLSVMGWIAIPLLISFLLPEYINPVAVFGAFFTDRILMFLIDSFSKKEAR